jgi:hypothetical protein
MLTYCVFGEFALSEAAALGLDGIRCDVPNDGDLEPFVRQFVGQPLAADFLLHDPGRAPELLEAIARTGLLEEQTSIEVYNEPPHKDKVDEDTYIEGVLDVWNEAHDREYHGTIIAGAQMNLSFDSMRWYAGTVPALPTTITVAFHDYPWGIQPTDLPWPPARSHQEALDTLRKITRDRPLVCSEFGRHMAIEITGHPPIELRLTEDWIYRCYLDRLRFFSENDLVWTALYQWRDAPNATHSEGLYGLHAVDPEGVTTRAKRQAEAITDWRGWTRR